MKKIVFMALALVMGLAGTSYAQLREIPKIVEENFSNQYKGASNIEYQDQLVRVDVRFELEGDTLLASYSNKGVWKETQKKWSYDRLSQEVKDGFSKSKYADRKVDEVIVLYLPGGSEQYRLRARKNDVEKKYLFFNGQGRLLREAITL